MRVRGEGPTPCRLMLIGEAPGRDEDRTGRPFVGLSGKELDRILELNDLSRDHIYITNIVKERPPFPNGKQLPPTKEEIERDEPELINEILRVRPKWIGAVGRVATRALTGQELDMEASWGLCYPLSVRLREMVRDEDRRLLSVRNAAGGDVRRGSCEELHSDLQRSELQDGCCNEEPDACVVESRTRRGTEVLVGQERRYSDLERWEVHLLRGSKDVGLSDERSGPHRSFEHESREMLRVREAEGGDIDEQEQIHSWIDEVLVIPLYHPAAGLRNSEIAKYVWRGVDIYARTVHGKLYPIVPRDEVQHPIYNRSLQSPQGMRDSVVACDTEGLPGRVWGGSVSCRPGSAFVFGVQETPAFKQVIEGAKKVVFHHSLHDVPILEEIGIPVDWSTVEDTYLMAYCLGLVPLGLKQLARRFCGMEMQSYLDVIAPADRKLALEYVNKALEAKRCRVCSGVGKVAVMRKDGKGYKKNPEKCNTCIDGGFWEERTPQLKYDWDTGVWKMSKGWSVGRYLRELRKDMDSGRYEVEDPETGEVQSVRKRITNWPDDVIEIITGEIGPLAEPTLDDIDPEAATYYSARDADATIRIYPILKDQITDMGLEEAYRLDLSVIPVAAEMQKNGMPIDREYFKGFVKELEYDNDRILARLEAKVGRPINPASGDQVAGLLFGEKNLLLTGEDQRNYSIFGWELEPEKRTKSGTRAAVDDKVLEALKLKHADNTQLVELLELITDYRMRDKILGTYARKLPEIATYGPFGDPTDPLTAWGYGIHTTIKPCRTATYRWASANPNLQNIPTREKKVGVDLGKRVRRGFCAPDGYILGSWDFDQIEMRVLAWYAKDETMLSVFRDGPTCPERFKYKDGKCRCHDMHYITASKTWRIGLDAVTSDQRVSAKNIGFGVVYGVTAKGLKAQMELRGQKWSEEECQRLIDAYLFEVYPGIGRFMMTAHAEARRYGYVRSLFGHIRYVPGVHSSVASVREEALRQAANFKIQCTAAELLKLSMRVLWTDYKPELDRVGARLLMAVHDELLLMVPDNEEAKQVTDWCVTSAMTNPVLLEGVEIGTSGKYGYRWDELK